MYFCVVYTPKTTKTHTYIKPDSISNSILLYDINTMTIKSVKVSDLILRLICCSRFNLTVNNLTYLE